MKRAPLFRIDEYSDGHNTKAVSEESVICNVLARLLNSSNQQHLKRLNESQVISDLPLVQLHLRHLAKICDCGDCISARQTPKRTKLRCYKEQFFYKVSLNAADIFALSLFQNSETLLVHFDPGDRGDRKRKYGFRVVICDKIKLGKSIACEGREVLAWALGLVGHSTGYVEGEAWVISCSQGQAVYPRVFETENICQSGYLVLFWAPGLLVFDGEAYDRGINPSYYPDENETIEVTTPSSRPVTGPLDLAPNMRMVWKVLRHDGYLEVFPVCGHHRGNPFSILFNLAHSLILEGCPHDSATALEKPDKFAKYMGPMNPDMDAHLHVMKERRPDSELPIILVAVDGDAGLQKFVLSSKLLRPSGVRPDIVLRSDSCLQCCLYLCRRFKVPILIC